ncbi:MAG: bifunctional precorrin-2 dehydrogenase/sirohydrochlorin ferrochelatase [Candidatus Bathyarchaeota archaeon]|nr:bifunctional precorrin-2 dehydrogenase/sirohydrochlorin ferrochelatase [Candidatus Bathyarchaeota archaeon]
MNDKTVFVIGAGAEAHRKLLNFSGSGAKIWVISKTFSNAIQELSQEKTLSLLQTEIHDAQSFFDSLNPKPDILLAVTDNSALNRELVTVAKAAGCIVYCVDSPDLSDFIFPAVARLGEVKVAVSTSGQSPAMARELRQRIERLITPEDLLEIELQKDMRKVVKEKIPSQKDRSQILHEILNNPDIKKLIKENKLKEAKEIALNHLEKQVTNNHEETKK